MATLERGVTLWGGPEDGLEVKVEEGAFQYFISGPVEVWDPNNIIADPTFGPRGRYQFNPETKRFEWMGYE